MKISIIINAMIVVLSLSACKTETKSVENVKRLEFGIYETVNKSAIGVDALNKLDEAGVILEKENPFILGYIKEDSKADLISVAYGKFKILSTKRAFKDNLKAIYAVNNRPVLANSSLKKCEADGTEINLMFKSEYTKKWAELTKKNIGRVLVITIDDYVCSAPVVMAEIRFGRATIVGFKDKAEASAIAKQLR